MRLSILSNWELEVMGRLCCVTMMFVFLISRTRSSMEFHVVESNSGWGVDSCDLINIQKINPLYHILDEKILFVPNSVFDLVDQEIAEYYNGYLPSIHGDSLRLGVLLSVVLPFVSEKARAKKAIQVWKMECWSCIALVLWTWYANHCVICNPIVVMVVCSSLWVFLNPQKSVCLDYWENNVKFTPFSPKSIWSIGAIITSPTTGLFSG